MDLAALTLETFEPFVGDAFAVGVEPAGEAPIEFVLESATSAGDWLITRRISAVAVCADSASRVSLNSRAFSMAMAAWSAKVSIRATWLSLNGRTSCR